MTDSLYESYIKGVDQSDPVRCDLKYLQRAAMNSMCGKFHKVSFRTNRRTNRQGFKTLDSYGDADSEYVSLTGSEMFPNVLFKLQANIKSIIICRTAYIHSLQTMSVFIVQISVFSLQIVNIECASASTESSDFCKQSSCKLGSIRSPVQSSSIWP